MGRAILDYDVISGLTQRIFNSRLLIYLLPVYLLSVKYLLIYLLIYFNLMAYGHTPFFPHVAGILSERQCQNHVVDQ